MNQAPQVKQHFEALLRGEASIELQVGFFGLFESTKFSDHRLHLCLF